MSQRTLTPLEHRILDFAASHDVTALQQREARAALVAEFAWRPATYLQRLERLVGDADAERERTFDVRRLRRVRDAGRVARTSTARGA